MACDLTPIDAELDAEFDAIMREIEATERAHLQAEADAYLANLRAWEPPRAPGCTCCERQLIQVGCDCGAEA